MFKKTVQELFIINFTCSVIAYVVFFAILFSINRFSEDKGLYLVASSVIFFNCIGMEWLYKGLEAYTYITIRSLIFKVIALIIMFFSIKTPDDYIMYGIFTVFASSASNVLNFIRARKFVEFGKCNLKELNLSRHIKAVLVFLSMSCAVTIYTNLDTVMLGFISGNVEVGYYNTAIKIKNMLVAFISSLGAVLLPRVSYYIKNGQWDAFNKLTRKSLHFVMLIAIPLSVYFMMYADSTIVFLAGDDYIKAVPAMIAIIPSIVFIGFSNITGIQILVPMGREKVVLVSEVVGGIVDFTLNIILIPMYGSLGAAISTFIAEFLVLIVQVVSLKDFTKRYISMRNICKFVFAVTVAGSLAMLIKILSMESVLMMLIISFIAFFGLYFLILVLFKDEVLTEMFSVIKRKVGKK